MVGHEPDPFLPLPPLSAGAARTEAERCLYCYDAPCARACPTGIDVPRSSARSRRATSRAAHGRSSRPTRWEPRAGPPAPSSACARAPASATTWTARSRSAASSATPSRRTRRRARHSSPRARRRGSAAIIGAGPAGLACAAELRQAGVGVTVYDANAAGRGAGRPRDRAVAPPARDGAATRPPGGAGRGAVRAGLDGRARRRACRRCSRATTPSCSPSAWATPSGWASPARTRGRDGRAGSHRARDRRHGPPITGRTGRRHRRRQHGVRRRGRGRPPRRRGGHPLLPPERGGVARLPPRDRAGPVPGCRHPLAHRPRGDPRQRRRPGRRLRRHDARRARRVRTAPPTGGGLRLLRRPGHDRAGRRAGRSDRPRGERAWASRSGAASPSRIPPRAGPPNPKVWAIGDITSGGAEVVNAVQAGKLAARSIVDALGLGGPRIVLRPPGDATVPGVDLFTDMAGIRSPNPFWLASCPITNNAEMVMRSFDAGWGGASGRRSATRSGT